MFVLYLSPYSSREKDAPYLWVLYKALSHIEPDNLVCIASEEYFIDPSIYRQKNDWDLDEWAQCYGEYTIPTIDELNKLQKYIISKDIFLQIENKYQSREKAFCHILTNKYDSLVSRLENIFDDILANGEVEGVITWCNNPSLKVVTEKYGLDLIHHEFGPFRKPYYQHTAYFDFEGVNGHTEAFKRFFEFSVDLKSLRGSLLERHELQTLMLSTSPEIYSDVSPSYEIGLPLQIEDDSNIIAYSKGFDNERLIKEAGRLFLPEQILIRKHPGGSKNYNRKSGDIDHSISSIEFIAKCKRIATINSSVGMESILFGRETYILGDSPFSFLANNQLGSLAKIDSNHLIYGLNYAILCYVMPYEFLFNVEYYRWRLKRPSLVEIYLLHRKYYEFIINPLDSSGDLPPLVADCILRYLARLASGNADLIKKNKVLSEVLDTLTSTWSWKVTEPLRRVGLLAQKVGLYKRRQ